MGVAMRTQSARGYFSRSNIFCPDCGEPMRLAAIMPATSVPKADVITYRCDGCRCDVRHITKPIEP